MSEDWTVIGGKKPARNDTKPSQSKSKTARNDSKPNQSKPHRKDSKPSRELKPTRSNDLKPTQSKPTQSKPARNDSKHPRVTRVLPLRNQPLPPVVVSTPPLPPPPPAITFASIAKKAVAPKVEEVKSKDTRLRLPPIYPYRWGTLLKCSVEDPSLESWKYHYEDRIRSVMDLLGETDFDSVGEYLYNIAPDKRIDVWA